MANELKMAIIESILQLHALHWSARRIARHLDIDRGTVRKYLVQALSGPKPAISPAGSEGSKPAAKPIGPAEAAKKVGKSVTLKMEVKSATLRGEIGFLNSEEDYKDAKNFLVFLDKTAVTKFKEAKIDDPADQFKGKTIEVHGKVELYHERPEIKVASPEQIKIVEAK